MLEVRRWQGGKYIYKWALNDDKLGRPRIWPINTIGTQHRAIGRDHLEIHPTRHILFTPSDFLFVQTGGFPVLSRLLIGFFPPASFPV
ncbi:hypothetical protein H1R20_g8220, partial [Candolleomyces eurysporus]